MTVVLTVSLVLTFFKYVESSLLSRPDLTKTVNDRLGYRRYNSSRSSKPSSSFGGDYVHRKENPNLSLWNRVRPSEVGVTPVTVLLHLSIFVITVW